MDVFLMIRRKNTTILLDATEETTVGQLKKTLEGILKKSPDEQQLYKTDSHEVLEDNKTLGDSGYKSQNAKAQDPGCIGLAFKVGDNEFEQHEITPYSNPPELPDVMKPPEGSGAASRLAD